MTKCIRWGQVEVRIYFKTETAKQSFIEQLKIDIEMMLSVAHAFKRSVFVAWQSPFSSFAIHVIR